MKTATFGICALAIAAVLAAPATGGEGEVLKMKSRLTPDLVPGGGDPDGSGHASIKIRPSERVVCFRVSFQGLEDVQDGTINVGRPDGPHGGRYEVILFQGNEAEGPQPIRDCLEVVNRPRSLRKIYNDSHRYYIEIEARGFRESALRGRLEPLAEP